MEIDDFIELHSSHAWVRRNELQHYWNAKCSVCSIHVEQIFGSLLIDLGSRLPRETTVSDNFPTCSTVLMRKALL